jgi:hypothetical protein
LGHWFLALAVITGLGTIAALGESLGITAVLGSLTVGAAFAAVAFLTGSSGWEEVAGWVLIGSAGMAPYVAGAMMIAGTWGRRILPLGEYRNAANIPGKRPVRALEYELGEPGQAGPVTRWWPQTSRMVGNGHGRSRRIGAESWAPVDPRRTRLPAAERPSHRRRVLAASLRPPVRCDPAGRHRKAAGPRRSRVPATASRRRRRGGVAHAPIPFVADPGRAVRIPAVSIPSARPARRVPLISVRARTHRRLELSVGGRAPAMQAGARRMAPDPCGNRLSFACAALKRDRAEREDRARACCRGRGPTAGTVRRA